MSPRNGDQNHRTVPKFGSFKPKSEPIPEVKPVRPSSGRAEGAEDVGKGRSHRSVHDPSHHQRAPREQRRSYSSANTPEPSRQRRNEAPSSASGDLDRNELFVVDKKGDPLILRYGSNDRSRVPSYRRFGRGKLMGANSRFEIRQNGTKEEWTFKEYRDSGSVFRDKRLMARLTKLTSRRVRRETDGTPRGDEDFIQLELSRKRKRGEEDSSSSDRDQPNYRSIEGKAKAEDFVDSDFESDSDSSGAAADDAELSTSRLKSIELSRRVRRASRRHRVLA